MIKAELNLNDGKWDRYYLKTEASFYNKNTPLGTISELIRQTKLLISAIIYNNLYFESLTEIENEEIFFKIMKREFNFSENEIKEYVRDIKVLNENSKESDMIAEEIGD